MKLVVLIRTSSSFIAIITISFYYSPPGAVARSSERNENIPEWLLRPGRVPKFYCSLVFNVKDTLKMLGGMALYRTGLVRNRLNNQKSLPRTIHLTSQITMTKVSTEIGNGNSDLRCGGFCHYLNIYKELVRLLLAFS